MERWGKLLAELKRPMDKRMFELITFAAAHELRHTSCSLAHGNALTPFFSKEEIVALAEQNPVDGVSDAELEMMRFSRKVARDASTIVEADPAPEGAWLLGRRGIRYCRGLRRQSVLHQGPRRRRLHAGRRLSVTRREFPDESDRRKACFK
jgi:hypothetical protein